MTSAEKLREAMGREVDLYWPETRPEVVDALLAAICDELGLSWERTDGLLYLADTTDDHHLAAVTRKVAEIFATLLEAAGRTRE